MPCPFPNEQSASSFGFGGLPITFTPKELKVKWALLVTDYNLGHFMARSPDLEISKSLESLRKTLERAEGFHAK